MELKIGNLLFTYTETTLAMSLSGKELSAMHFAEVPTQETLFGHMDRMLNGMFFGAEKIEVTVKKGEPYSPPSIFEVGKIKDLAFLKKAEDEYWVEYTTAGGMKCQICPRKQENDCWQIEAGGDRGHERYLRYDGAREVVQLISGSSRAGTVGLQDAWRIGGELKRWDLSFDGHLQFKSHEYVAFVRFVKEGLVKEILA